MHIQAPFIEQLRTASQGILRIYNDKRANAKELREGNLHKP
jgi:hypothetical protein